MKKFNIKVLAGVLTGLFLSVFSSLALGFTGLVGFAALTNIEVPLASPVIDYTEGLLNVSSFVPYPYEFTDITESLLPELKKATEEGGYTLEELLKEIGLNNKDISSIPEKDRPSKATYEFSFSSEEKDLDTRETSLESFSMTMNMLTDIRTQDIKGDLTVNVKSSEWDDTEEEEYDAINEMNLEYGYITTDEIIFGKVTIDEDYVKENMDSEALEYVNKWVYYDISEIIEIYNERYSDQIETINEPTAFELTDEEYKLIEKILTSDEIQPEIVDLPGKTFDDGRARCYMWYWDEKKISDFVDYLEKEIDSEGDFSDFDDLKEMHVSFCTDRVTMKLYEIEFGMTIETSYSGWNNTIKMNFSIAVDGYGKYLDISLPKEAKDLGPIIDENIDWEEVFDELERGGFPGMLSLPVSGLDVSYDLSYYNYEEDVGNYTFKFEYDEEFNSTIYKCLNDDCVLSDYDEYYDMLDAARGYIYDYDYDDDANRYYEYYTTADYVYTLTYDLDTYDFISGKKCPIGSSTGCIEITEDQTYEEIGYWN
ncbi:hypothetical protein JW962_02010 [Candidatus Dojkabacteria bacterium]|nr:hypothetical protein [Candidatus Dojkabacteria bacterium]